MVRSFFLISLLLISYLSIGQTKTFNTVGMWHEDNNWTPIGVPTAIDSVVIFGVCTIEADSTAHARHVKVEENWVLQIDRDLSINAPGRLNLMPFNMTEEVGLLINGTLLQGGRLNINGYPSHALINNGFINCQDRSKTIIDAEIDNNSDLEISGELTIDASAFDYCVSSEGDSLIIREGGVLNVAGAETGIRIEENSNLLNQGLTTIAGAETGIRIKENSSLLNQGLITIDSIDGDGIRNSGTFINDDSILISNCQYGIENEFDTILNSGLIHIIQCESGIENDVAAHLINSDSIILDSIEDIGILNRAELFNEGTINILNIYENQTIGMNLKMLGLPAALKNEGVLINQGTLIFDDIQKVAISNSDSLVNVAGGHIEIKNGVKSALNNQRNGKIDNFGSIEVQFMESTAIDNLGVIHNHDTIKLQDFGFSGLINENEFMNSSGAYFKVEKDGYSSESDGTISNSNERSYQKLMNDQPFDQTIPYGILNWSPTDTPMITNEGKIVILECVNALRNVGQFINMDSLLIFDIFDMGISKGISNTQASEEEPADVDFINNGYIYVSAGFGLMIGLNTEFVNEGSGILKIVSDDDDPLIVELGGILDCFGELDISSGMSTTGPGQ